MLHEVIDRREAEPSSDEEDSDKPEAADSGAMSAFDALKAGVKSNEADDGAVKAQDDAIDYSDITELSEDCPRTPPEQKEPASSSYDDLEDAIPASKVETKLSKSTL